MLSTLRTPDPRLAELEAVASEHRLWLDAIAPRVAYAHSRGATLNAERRPAEAIKVMAPAFERALGVLRPREDSDQTASWLRPSERTIIDLGRELVIAYMQAEQWDNANTQCRAMLALTDHDRRWYRQQLTLINGGLVARAMSERPGHTLH